MYTIKYSMGGGGYKTGVEEVEHGEGSGCKTGQNNRRVTFPACAAAHFVQQSGAGPRLERKERVSSCWSAGRECKVQPTHQTGYSQGAARCNHLKVQVLVKGETLSYAAILETGCDTLWNMWL